MSSADTTETKRDVRRLRRRAAAIRDAIETATDELDRLEDALDEADGDSDEDSDADQLAATVMTLQDVEAASHEQLSPAEFLEDRHGVDVAAADGEADLREQLGAANTGSEEGEDVW